MNVSLVYLLAYLGRRITDFLLHWYVDGFLKATHWSYNFLERLDRIFALRITLKNWFQPLYQDYSLIGYFWGFLFRSARLLVGGLIYAVFIGVSVLLYLAWASLPTISLYNIFFK